VLAKTLIIPKEENFVLADRSAQRASEDVALKLRRAALIEVIASIERAVAKKFVSVPVNLVRARSSNNAHLRARSFAVFGAIRIRHNVEFAHRIDAQELSAGAAWSDVDLRCSCVLNSVQQE